MTKKRRTRLFYLLVLLFFIFGGVAVFYAQGWRFDGSSLAFGKVGAIYVRTFPEEAAVTLDGKPLRQRPGLFDRGIFINNLFPRTYTVEASAPDHKPWKARVSVLPSLVAQLKYLVLVPEKKSVALPGPVERLWLAGERLVTRSGAGILFAGSQRLPGREVVGQTKNGNGLITYDPSRGSYFWSDLRVGTSTSLSTMLRETRDGIRLPARISLAISDREDGVVGVFSTSSLYLLNAGSGEVRLITQSTSTGPIAAVAVSPQWIAWSAYNGRTNISAVSGYDRITRRLVGNAISLPGKTTSMSLSDREALAVLQDTGDLYLGVPGETLKGLASDVRSFSFTNDGEKIAAREAGAIEVFSLTTDDEMYWRFDLLSAADIRNVLWYEDNHHLFLAYPDRVSFLDFADKELRNVGEIARGKDFSYDESRNLLYFISDGAAFQMEFPQ